MTAPKEPHVHTIDEARVWLQPRHFDMTTEAGAREALARVASSGTLAERKIVREVAARDFPNIGKGPALREMFPNSNMK